jgi:hypothetical protein
VKNLGWGTIVAVCLLAVFAAGSLGATVFALRSARSLPSVGASGPTCDQGWSAGMVEAAQRAGVIEHMDFTRDGFVAVVDGPRFMTLSYPAKEQLAVALDCQIAQDGNHLTAVRFRRDLHGANLAEFRSGDLLRARARYAAADWQSRGLG